MARDRRPVGRASARRRPAEARRRADTRRAIFILAGAAVAILGVVAALFLSRTQPLDAESGCVLGRLIPPEHTVVLIDQTDPLTARQIAYVKAVILAEYDRLRPQGKLTIRSIGANSDTDANAFARCRVRRGSEVSGLASNPEMIEGAFRRTVGDALNAYLNSLRTVPTSPRSPILEAAAQAQDAPDFGPTVAARRLVIVSDMAQNSDLDSEYHGPGSGLALSARAQDTLGRDMKGVVVRIHYVRRPALDAIQTPEQRAFWTDWFRDQGATSVKLGWGLQLVDGRVNTP